jgi:hypothetical protein
MAIPHWILRNRNVPNISCRKSKNYTFYVRYFFFSFENRAVYEIMSKNMVEPERPPQMAIWRRVARWISSIQARAHKYVRLNCFSTTTMVSWTRLSATLYVHCCPSSLNLPVELTYCKDWSEPDKAAAVNFTFHLRVQPDDGYLVSRNM